MVVLKLSRNTSENEKSIEMNKIVSLAKRLNDASHNLEMGFYETGVGCCSSVVDEMTSTYVSFGFATRDQEFFPNLILTNYEKNSLQKGICNVQKNTPNAIQEIRDTIDLLLKEEND